jgi:hypothetical protein
MYSPVEVEVVVTECAVKWSGYGLNDLKPSVVVREIHF